MVPDDRTIVDRAVPRRDRRLAGVRAQPVRHAGARAVGDGDRAPPGRPLRPARSSRCGATTASCCVCPRRPTSCRSTRSRSIPRTSRSWWCRRCRRRRCSRRGSASAPAGRCCCRGAVPTSAPRCGSSASAPPTCSPWPPSTRRSPCCSRRHESACRTCSTCRRCARCSGSCARGRCGWSRVETPKPSPMAQSLLFNWIAAYMYEGDAPARRAPGRRAGARPRPAAPTCSAPRSCASCSIPSVLADVELDLQRLSDGRRARSADELHDVLRRLGDLTARRARAALRRRHDWQPAAGAWRCWSRSSSPSDGRSRSGRRRGSASPRPRTPPATATRSAARCRSACPQVFTDPVPRPLEDLVGRYARTHGPFVERDVAARFGAARGAGRSAPSARWRPRAAWCAASSGPTACGASGATSTCCVSSVAGRWRCCAARSSRSSRTALAEFLPAWQGVGTTRARASSRWSRRSGSSPAHRSSRRRSSATCSRPGSPTTARRCSTSCARRARSCGSGAGAIGSNDGRVRLCFADQLAAARAELGRGRPPRRAAARHDPRRARRRRGELLGAAARRRGRPHRRRAARRAVGPRLGRRGHERLAGARCGP